MSTCGSKLSIFDNPKYKDLLSDQEFIKYLIASLEANGYTAGLPVIVRAGDKIVVTDNSIEDEVYDFTVAYLDAKPPQSSISVTPNTVEKGVIIPIGDLDLSYSFIRKTYKLKQVLFTGINVSDLQTADLEQYITEGQGGSGVGTNTAEIGRLDTFVANITIEDINGNQQTATANLSRLDRWYWGVTEDANLNSIDVNTAVATGLGNPPNTIAANVGNGKYVWVAFTSAKAIRDTTLETNQVEATDDRIIQPVSGYNKNYFFQRTGELSGGTINLLIN